jgi:alpha-beta hydrolase superfamily lysophospholipase
MPEAEPRAVIQIAHGMQEYAGRYADTAAFLTRHGIAVFANDHRGHGKSLTASGKPGDLGAGGRHAVLTDMHLLSRTIRDRHPGVPLFLLGHSWGSFLTQAYIQRWGTELSGAILSATNGANPLVGIGVYVSRLVAAVRGDHRIASLLETLSIGGLNKQFEPGATGKEWISRDQDVVRRYVDDPLCAQPFPNSFYVEMTVLLAEAWRKEAEARVPKSLPVYLVAGDRDPVGLNGKGVQALAKRYRSHGLKDVTVRLYPEARHEVLNETNRQEVFDDLLAWVEQRL